MIKLWRAQSPARITTRDGPYGVYKTTKNVRLEQTRLHGSQARVARLCSPGRSSHARGLPPSLHGESCRSLCVLALSQVSREAQTIDLGDNIIQRLPSLSAPRAMTVKPAHQEREPAWVRTVDNSCRSAHRQALASC